MTALSTTGARTRDTKWLGWGRSDTISAGSVGSSPLEEDGSLEATLYQGVAVPCTLFSSGEWYGSNINSSYKTNDQDICITQPLVLSRGWRVVSNIITKGSS